MGEFPSGQREQTVNLSVIAFGGSNPPSPTSKCVHNGFVMNTLIFLWCEMFLCAEVFHRNALSCVRNIGFLFNFLGKFQCSDKAVIDYDSLCVGF